MPCFLLLVILLFPRIALALMWFFSTYLQRAFHGGLLLPVLGFIFLPLTTIVYAWELNSGMPTAGINLLWLLIAVIIGLGGLGGGAQRQSRVEVAPPPVSVPMAKSAGPLAESFTRTKSLPPPPSTAPSSRSEEHTSELQSPCNLVCRLLLEKK